MNSEEIDQVITGCCNVFEGLKIITKYVPHIGIEGAEDDIVYSVNVDKLLDADITKEDTIILRSLGWLVDDDDECLACLV